MHIAIVAFVLGIALLLSNLQSASAQHDIAWPNVGRACATGLGCEAPRLKQISRDEWGAERWPLTVNRAVVACFRPLGPGGQIVVAGGGAWAANGMTQTMAKRFGLTIEVDGKTLAVRPFDIDDARVKELWAELPKPKGAPADTDWGRIDWGPIIDTARKLGCDL